MVKGPPELDAATAPGLHDEVALLLTVGATRVVIDLSGVSFIDSSGLGALVGLRRQASRMGVDLRVRNIPPRVYRTMEVSGILEYLGIEPETD